MAIRTLYLRSLQNLSKANYINWEIDKTNRQYIQELGANKRLAAPFTALTHEYENYWYGEVDMEASRFQYISAQFDSFHDQIHIANT